MLCIFTLTLKLTTMNKKELQLFAQDFMYHTGLKVKAHEIYTDVMLELYSTSLNVLALKAITEYLEKKFHVEDRFNGTNKAISMQPIPRTNSYGLCVRITRKELERVFKVNPIVDKF